MNTPSLRPMRVGDILDRAISIYRHNWLMMSLIMLIIDIPTETFIQETFIFSVPILVTMVTNIPMNGSLIFNFIIGAVMNILVTPFLFTTITLLYYDLRIRKEGFDLQILADQLTQSPNSSQEAIA